MSTICACGYLLAVYACWTLIHEFRFSAVWPQDTMAYLPLPPIADSRLSVSASPIFWVDAWLTNTSRTESGASVSEVITLIPLAWASLSTGAIESGSFGATTITCTPRWMNDRTICVCAAASACVGPWYSQVTSPSDCSAPLPPVFIASKYGIPCSFGTNATWCFAPPAPPPPAVSELFFWVQPATASTATRPTTTAVFLINLFIEIPPSRRGGVLVGGANGGGAGGVGPGRGARRGRPGGAGRGVLGVGAAQCGQPGRGAGPVRPRAGQVLHRREGRGDDGPDVGEPAQLAQRGELHGRVAERGRLTGAAVHRQPGGIGGQLGQQGVAGAAA